MKLNDVRPQPFTQWLVCDRCGRQAERDDLDCDFHEFTSIQYKAGYGSVFGDGNDIELDLCQHCVKDTLGTWVRITDLHAGFSLEQHSGEFPNETQSSFIARGRAAIERSIQYEDGIPAEQVIAKLEERLAEAREAHVRRQLSAERPADVSSEALSVGDRVTINRPLPHVAIDAGTEGTVVHMHESGDRCDVRFEPDASGLARIETMNIDGLFGGQPT